jgi:aspartate/methionine/tyrosine aminotransferase
MGGVPVAVELDAADGYQLSRAQLEAKYTARTRMVLLTHPNNPTTTIYNRASLQALADFVQEHDLILVVDQAFEDYTFGAECLTPAALPGMFERTVTVFSFSKGMGLSGMRVGYIVCSDQIMDSMYANAVGVIGATSTSGQKAALAALEHPEFMQEFARAYEVRRRKAYEILNCVPGVHMALPESGFLGWIDVSELGNSTEIAQYLVTHARVSLNDGVNYGPGGAGHLRIVLGVYKDDQKVINALERIRDALLAYPRK